MEVEVVGGGADDGAGGDGVVVGGGACESDADHKRGLLQPLSLFRPQLIHHGVCRMEVYLCNVKISAQLRCFQFRKMRAIPGKSA